MSGVGLPIALARRSMRTRSLVCLTALVGAITLEGGEAAADDKSLYSFGVAVVGVGGLGSPVGFLGVDVRLDLAPWFYLAGAAGLNPSPQLAAMAHLRVPLPHSSPARQFALSAGYGRSRGEYAWHYFSSNFEWEQEAEYGSNKAGFLWWHNFQLDVEVRVRQPGLPVIVAGGFAGLAVAGNPEDLHCVEPDVGTCEVLHPNSGAGPLPYAGVFAGIAFN